MKVYGINSISGDKLLIQMNEVMLSDFVNNILVNSLNEIKYGYTIT